MVSTNSTIPKATRLVAMFKPLHRDFRGEIKEAFGFEITDPCGTVDKELVAAKDEHSSFFAPLPLDAASGKETFQK
jgi:hypothetical protein